MKRMQLEEQIMLLLILTCIAILPVNLAENMTEVCCNVPLVCNGFTLFVQMLMPNIKTYGTVKDVDPFLW